MKRKVGALEKIEADHAALRYKLKRDPESYRDDFRSQYQQYETLRDLLLEAPSASDSGLVALKDLIDFVSHVADKYPDLTVRNVHVRTACETYTDFVHLPLVGLSWGPQLDLAPAPPSPRI